MNAPLWREAVIDLTALTRNVAHLRARIPTRHTMVVVKANGYGHGAVESARAAVGGGADWLGTADIDEALALREAGLSVRILAWLHDPDADFGPAIAGGIDIGVSSIDQLRAVAAARDAWQVQGRKAPAAVQLKLDTGLRRNGLDEKEWFEALAEARRLEIRGAITVTGIFSHLSNASPEDDAQALAAFERGLEMAAAAGLTPEVVHIAASAAALRIPESRFNLVRIGLAAYGLSPLTDLSSADLGLTPVMTLRGRVAAVRHAGADEGVSYDYTYRTSEPTTLALIPLGYADGIPRHASNSAPISLAGSTFTISGRVAMDQFVVDVGARPVAVGDPVILFGDPADGIPSADDWARAADTISYEIVTRIGARVPRTFIRS